MAFFSVTWRIENFSMFPHRHKEEYLSPVFALPELVNTKWNLLLFPKGNKDVSEGNYISIFLKRTDQDQTSELTLFHTKLTVVTYNSNSSSETYKNNFIIHPNKGWGYPKVISHEKLYNPANGFLPNDTLTIHLHICPVLDNNETIAATDIKTIFSNPLHPNYTVEKCFSKDSETEDMSLNHCSFLTRISVERKTLNWTLKELSTKRKSKEKMSVVLDSEFEEGIKLQLVCHVEGSSKENEDLKMDISRKGMDLRGTFIKCEISFLDDSDVVKGSKKCEHVFGETYKLWSFSLIDELGSSKKLLNDDSLKLKCDFLISYEPQNVDYFIEKNHSSNQNKLQDEIQRMLEHEDTKNFSFECKSEKKFPVHQFLICAKSPVFRAMFSSDTLEKQTGVVRMQDIDTTTVQHLRDYLYSNFLPDLEIDDMLKLYSVADKYQIENLKDKCTTFLKCNLTLDNVLDILTKADMHQDSGLKDYATDFIIAEMDFDSDLWETFMVKNLSLAAETMRKFCVRKRSD